MKIATRGDRRVLAMVLANTSAGAAVRDSSRLDAVRTRIDHTGWPHFAREYVASRLAPMTSGPQVEQYVRSVIGATPKVFVQTMASILEQDLRPVLSKVDCPTLVLTGDSDISTPLAAAEELRAAIPKAELVVLSRAGHFSVLDSRRNSRQDHFRFLLAVKMALGRLIKRFDCRNDAVADGLTEEVAMALTRVPGLFVTARRASR